MMNLQINADAEGVFKRFGRQRTRKKHWREAERLKAKDIRQTMRAPKLFKDCKPRVMPDASLESATKQTLADRSDRLKFVGPVLRPNRRMKQRRKDNSKWEYTERRTRDRRTRQSPPKKRKAKPHGGSVTTALFKPSVKAARELATVNDSLFDKLFNKRTFEKVIKD